jgi:hypothetical protein
VEKEVKGVFTMRALAAILMFVPCMVLYVIQRVFRSGMQDGTSLSAVLTVTVVIVVSFAGSVCIYRYLSGRMPSDRPRKAIRYFLVFAVLFSALFIIRGSQNMRLLPPAFNYEAHRMDMHAQQLHNHHPLGRLLFNNYNVGLAPFYVPVFAITGHSLTVSKSFYIAFYLICLLGLAWILYRSVAGFRPVSSFGILVSLTCVVESMRRHKWHSVMLLAALAVLLSGFANQSKRPWVWRTLAIFLVLGTSVLYRGALLTVPLIFLVMVLDCFIHRKGWLFFGVSGLIVVGILGGLFWLHPPFYKSFIMTRVMNEGQFLMNHPDQICLAWGSLFRFFHPDRMFWVYGIICWTGLVHAVTYFKSEWISRYLVVGSVYWTLGMLGMKYGFRNHDENNYILLFIMGLMVLGMTQFTRIIYKTTRKPVLAGIVIAVIVLGSVYMEWKVDEPLSIYQTESRNPILTVMLLDVGDRLSAGSNQDIHVFNSKHLPDINQLRKYPSFRRILEQPHIELISSESAFSDLLGKVRSRDADVVVHYYLSSWVKPVDRAMLPIPSQRVYTHPLGIAEQVRELIYLPEEKRDNL